MTNMPVSEINITVSLQFPNDGLAKEGKMDSPKVTFRGIVLEVMSTGFDVSCPQGSSSKKRRS